MAEAKRPFLVTSVRLVGAVIDAYSEWQWSQLFGLCFAVLSLVFIFTVMLPLMVYMQLDEILSKPSVVRRLLTVGFPFILLIVNGLWATLLVFIHRHVFRRMPGGKESYCDTIVPEKVNDELLSTLYKNHDHLLVELRRPK